MTTKEIFDQLRRTSGYPCVSLLLPTHRTAPENYQDEKVFKNLARDARERLLNEFEERDVKFILDNLESVQETIDHQQNKEGMAVFISDGVCKVVRVSVPVEARVVIDHNFATRPVIRAMNSHASYYAMTLSESHIRLLEVSRDRAHEVNDFGFPVENKHHHVTHKMRTVWTKEEDEQVRDFFREVDQKFDEVYKAHPRLLVLAGSEHALDNFRHVTDHTTLILTSVNGNYDNTPAGELGPILWPHVKSANQHRQIREMDKLGEARGSNKVALGLAEVYATAVQGRGDTLFVEDNFFHPAKVVGSHLETMVSREDPEVIDDIVDEIAETVLSMKGKVVFVEPAMLADYGSPIAMTLRY